MSCVICGGEGSHSACCTLISATVWTHSSWSPISEGKYYKEEERREEEKREEGTGRERERGERENILYIVEGQPPPPPKKKKKKCCSLAPWK